MNVDTENALRDWKWLQSAVVEKLTVNKLNVRDAAAQIGCGHATISRIANGYEPSVPVYLALVQWLRGTSAIRNCTCISYNLPQPYQTTPEAVLTIPDWVKSEKLTVCVDACIAPVIKRLWSKKVWTLGSCCGHNVDANRAIVVDRTDRPRAAAVVRAMGDTAHILAWELVEGDVYHAALPSFGGAND